MSRVSILDEHTAPLAARPLWAKGSINPIAATLAHVPDLAQVALPFVMRTLGGSEKVRLRTKEIAILRASALQQCRYCTETHTVLALDAGLTTPEVRALRGEGDPREVFTTPGELALIAWTDAVAAGGKPVEDAVATRLRSHYSEPEVVELTLVVATTVLLNRYATALDLPTAEAHLLRLTQAGLSSR